MKKINAIIKQIDTDYPEITKKSAIPIKYDMSDEMEILTYLSERLLGYKYIFHSDNKLVYKKILDNMFTAKPNKGILLMGKIGNGKTDLFRLIHKYTYYRFLRKFVFSDTKIISNEYMKTGFIDRYIGRELYIDDIGVERTVNRYGNNEDVVYELIMTRYADKRFVTHATTNFDRKTLQKRFGDRAYSRMQEMFEFLPFKGDDKRN